MTHLAFFLVAALWLSATAATAQTTFRLGVRGGANRAATTLDPAGNASGNYPFSYSSDKSAIYAWQAGVVLEASRGQWAVQPSLLFSQKGEYFTTTNYMSGFTGYNTEEVRSINRYNWVELPVNVVYTLHGWQVFAGPYVAVAVGGQRRGEVTSDFYGPPTYQVPSNHSSSDFSTAVTYGQGTNNCRFDAGVNFGIGYCQGPMQVQLGYGLGLVNLHKSLGQDSYHNFAADAAYNRIAQLTGTYFFAL